MAEMLEFREEVRLGVGVKLVMVDANLSLLSGELKLGVGVACFRANFYALRNASGESAPTIDLSDKLSVTLKAGAARIGFRGGGGR